MSATASAKGTANPMRRTAEHDYVTSLTQIGIRNVSSTGRDYAHAISTNSTIISVRQASRLSTAGVLERMRADERDYLAIVIDAFDPSITLGTETPSHTRVPLLRGH